MNDYNIIDTLLYDWATLYSGITVIWQNSNGPKPDLPFIALRRQSVSGIGSGYIASPQDGSIIFDSDLITGNTIDMDINGVSISQVTFTTDHDTTMALIIDQLLLNSDVSNAVLYPEDTDDRTIIITFVGTGTNITNIVVASGASQAGSAYTDGLTKISGDREMVINFQAYGTNAFGTLENLWEIRQIPASQELLSDGGLALINNLLLIDITGLNDLEYEERATMDLLFRFAFQKTAINVGLIEEINITGYIKEPDKELTFNTDLTQEG